MTVAIVDRRMSKEAVTSLSGRGFRVIRLPACERLPEATGSHPDMLIMRLGDSLFVEATYFEQNTELFCEISSLLPRIRIKCIGQPLGAEYPRDSILNVLRIGDKLFIKSDSAAEEIMLESERLGLRTVSVKQGYPACTVLSLGDSHAITADRGMARALRGEGIETLLIENGDVSLPPYEYGFIGGCAGTFGDTVYFLGDPNYHRDRDLILSAIDRAGMKWLALADEPLTDLGRIVFCDDKIYNNRD